MPPRGAFSDGFVLHSNYDCLRLRQLLNAIAHLVIVTDKAFIKLSVQAPLAKDMKLRRTPLAKGVVYTANRNAGRLRATSYPSPSDLSLGCLILKRLLSQDAARKSVDFITHVLS